jgi:translation elongation factor EF-Tu-like GTPase
MMLVFTARIRLVDTDAGGRHRSIRSGYIAGIRYGGQIVDGLIHLIGCDVLSPGEESTASLRVPKPEHAGQPWEAGKVFDMVEGPRTIGTGEILSIEPTDA